MTFRGFPKQGLEFFRKLRKKNTREWFDAHKDEYLQYCRAPMEELAGEVNRGLARFAPEHIAEPKKAIYRIHRDTRFSKDKTPYKTHIAANFPRGGMEKHAAAGFYFSVSDEGLDIAGGVYMPGPPELAAIRHHILARPGEFKKIVTNRKLVESMGPLQGESLKKVPRGFPDDSPAADFLRMKQWMFFKTFDPAVAADPELADFVIARMKAAAPLVAFLNAPLLALPRERALE
jgi:uncharacterized protein (TIGR02453 family)